MKAIAFDIEGGERRKVLAEADDFQMTYTLIRDCYDNTIANFNGDMWIDADGEQWSDIVITNEDED